MAKPKTHQDYHLLAGTKGFVWIGDFPKSTHHKTLWRCGNGHIWTARYDNIKTGYGCPACANNSRRRKHQKKRPEYNKLAKERQLRFVGELPRNTKEKTRFECIQCGYIWYTSYGSLSQGCGCPRCIGLSPKKRQDYISLAKLKGVTWIGDIPKNTKEKTEWECPKEHTWKTSYHTLLYGRGCPRCMHIVNGKKVSSQQIKVAEMVGGILNFQCGNIFIDVALPEQKIAIEYDSWFWHAYKQKQDGERTNRLLDMEWRVIIIKSNTRVPSLLVMEEAIEKVLEDGFCEVLLDDWEKGKPFGH